MKRRQTIFPRIVALLLVVSGVTFLYVRFKPSGVESAITSPSPLNFYLVNETKQSIAPQVAAGERSAPGFIVVNSKEADAGVEGYFLLGSSPDFPGAYISEAWPALGSSGNWSVMVDFSSEGSQKFAQLTGDNVGKRMAIVLDDLVLAAPRISSSITGAAEITGKFTESEARSLVASLQ